MSYQMADGGFVASTVESPDETALSEGLSFSWEMFMKIENMRKVDFGSVKAFFTVDLEKIKVHGCKLIQQTGQEMWCSMPDEKYTDKDGKTKYKKIVEVADIALAGKIAAAAIEEYNADVPF
jgi:DNA-binding cell septation regulator SpoVG